MIQLALQLVASESIKIYQAISDGTVNMIDKFFEMRREDALEGLSELEERNALALAIVPADQQPSTVQIMQMEPLVRNWLLLQLLAQMRVLQQLANWLEVWTCLH